MATRRAGKVFILALLAGCSGVLGIEEATLDDSVGARTERQSCVLESDCPDDELCIFRVCSPPCAQDRDCAAEQACLRAEETAVCILPSDSSCETSAQCPSGTRCMDEACRTRCAEPSDCLPAQHCIEGACRGVRLDGEGIASLLDGSVVDPGDAGGAGGTSGAGGSGVVGGTGGNDAGADAMVDDGCEPTDKRCESGDLFICRSDRRWDEGAPCPYVCIEDECAGECVPGDRRCTGDKRQTCDSDGVWQDIETCPRVCTVEACVDRCETGDRRCDESNVLTCTNAGAYEVSDECDYVCKAGACIGECLPGDEQCSGGDTELCDADGDWIDGIDCEFDCAADRCVGECAPGTFRCTEGSSTLREECNDDFMWEATTACPFYCDDGSGRCAGECTPGDDRCASGSNTVREICGGDYAWSGSETCGFVCVDATGACGGNCRPGAFLCDPDAIDERNRCNDQGEYALHETCPFVCIDATNACGGECEPGSASCENAAPSTSHVLECGDDGFYSMGDDCDYPAELCTSNRCAGNNAYNRGYNNTNTASSSVSVDYLFAIPVTLDRRVTIERFGLHAMAAPNNVSVRMALYRDNGGVPGAIVARSSNRVLDATGTLYINLNMAVPAINAGNYWIAAVYSGDAPAYARFTTAALGDAYYVAHDYDAQLPDPFTAGGSALPDTDYLFFVEVRNSL
jgi:hypothetical protein